MRKDRKLMLATTLLIATTVAAAGCSKSKDDKKEAKETTTVQQEIQTNAEPESETVTNNITYEMNGEPVKDDSVFGENVIVFSPEEEYNTIQEKVDEIYTKQEKNQFGSDRYEILFKPGEYDPRLEVNVGYYTKVAGLGVNPTETKINKLWCNADWMYHNATCNFWRSAENFSPKEYTMWATSQAVSLRRMDFRDGMVLSDGEGWSSGGFMADTRVAKIVSSGSQQQWFSRNDQWAWWDGGVWNMVFTGITKTSVPAGTYPSVPYTYINESPVVQEKPFMAYDEEHGYGIMIPQRRENAVGISWAEGTTGTFVSLNDFYIAKPGEDDSLTLNTALSQGKNILFTPGIYELSQPLKVEYENTILYGMGLATLVATEGNSTVEVADVSGVKMCGMIFEAGDNESKTLLNVGGTKSDVSHKDNPIVLSDLYFRVGGSNYIGKTESCVEINSNDVIGDNFWVWRADHGSNVAWDSNTAKNGIIINGDDVTMYGLFVEHFQEYQTIWNGNGGKLYFYQSEIPYDVPSQDVFKSHDGTVDGFASYKVGDDVTSHEAYGLGVYSYNRDAEVYINSAIEVPDKDGVKIEHAVAVVLNGNPGINHVVNEEGYAISRAGQKSNVALYENGKK
ncbi:MAG: sialidase [Lachnospiraceae bacterium]|nr:sialidase [Lachnospiraceae bacterium]